MEINRSLFGDVLFYGGGVTGLVFFGLSILRAVGLRASKDALTIREDSAQRDTIAMLQTRINQMDKRVAVLEISRNKLFSFSMKMLAFISQCNCTVDDEAKKQTRKELGDEFKTILEEEAEFITKMQKGQ